MLNVTNQSRHLLSLAATVLFAGIMTSEASANPIFSVTFHGPPKGLPSFFGFPITEGDLLVPVAPPGPPAYFPAIGPLPPVAVAVSGGFGPMVPGLALPMHAGALGVAPGAPGFVELDGVSYGRDYPIRPQTASGRVIWAFSVDEFTTSFAGPLPPNVFTSGPVPGAFSAAARVFVDVAQLPGPVCAPLAVAGNTLLLDCDGVAPPAGYPGIIGPPGFEINPPAMGVPDPGADIDALDIDPPRSTIAAGLPGYSFPIYYSLDAGFFNAIEGIPNSNSAAANGGFLGGDVLVCPAPGAAPIVYAPAAMLGIPGAGNDLDGLILWENGIAGYQPPTVPYSWVPGVAPVTTDMLFYSVRRGSAVVGVIDGMCGTPISPADILWGPAAAGGPPRKWMAAGQLGLLPNDNIDALDLLRDCNGNGKPDNFDVLMGGAVDLNGNLIPDSCECLADINGDGVVNVADMLLVIGNWGAGAGNIADVNFDGTVGVGDLLAVIAAWGNCP